MKDVVQALKARRAVLREELSRVEKALLALTPEAKVTVPRVLTPEHRQHLSDAQRKRHATKTTAVA